MTEVKDTRYSPGEVLTDKYIKSGPHAWIQWKGTSVCADVHCTCGHQDHVDEDFFYSWKCPECRAEYSVSGYVVLVRENEHG